MRMESWSDGDVLRSPPGPLDLVSRRQLTLVTIQGCKIVQVAGHGGSIVSTSGEYDCPEDRIRTVDVPEGEAFRDIFTAVPREGGLSAVGGPGRRPGYPDRDRPVIEPLARRQDVNR